MTEVTESSSHTRYARNAGYIDIGVDTNMGEIKEKRASQSHKRRLEEEQGNRKGSEGESEERTGEQNA